MIHLGNVDWHATDRCNLRCVSCGHFCSLVNHLTDETDRTPEQAEADFSILYQITNNGEYVDQLCITGGECTLNKNLPEIIDIAEKYFQNKVILWSNCINTNLYTEDLINKIKEYNISINVTIYNDLSEQKIYNFLNDHNIQYNVFIKNFDNDRNTKFQFFDKFFTRNKIEGIHNTYCPAKFWCGQLKDQKYYPCQYLAYIDYYINYFNDNELKNQLNLKEDNRYIDLTKVNNYEEIEQFIINYNEEICDHCIDKYVMDDFENRVKNRLQDWKISEKNPNEWVINDISEIF